MRVLTFLALLISLSNLVGCGRSYEDADIRDYHLFLDTEDADAQREFRSLIDTFNDKAGFKALYYKESSSDGNCPVILTEGLEQRDGKVGWGQWIKNTQVSAPFSRGLGKSQKRYNIYTMRLEFDKEYFLSRLNSDDDSKRMDLFKLFAHESGHGLQMDHTEGDSENVMYPDISGTKDFDAFFARVRDYFDR